MDTTLFHAINGLAGSPFWDAIMSFFTLIGVHAEVWIAIALVLILGAGRLPGLKERHWRTVGLFLLLALAVGYGVEEVLKNMIGRVRPASVLADVHVLAPMPKATSFSMPSGHATTALAAAWLLHRAGLKWWPFAVAVVICFSRVYTGHHYPSDVLAGAALGVVVAEAVYRIYTRLQTRRAVH